MLNVKSIKKLEDRNKTVLVRFDLNVPLDEVSGKVNDRLTRIKNTINQLQELNSKIVILSHLGRPKGIVNNLLSLKRIIYSHILSDKTFQNFRFLRRKIVNKLKSIF